MGTARKLLELEYPSDMRVITHFRRNLILACSSSRLQSYMFINKKRGHHV